jgi:hypothetical protein
MFRITLVSSHEDGENLRSIIKINPVTDVGIHQGFHGKKTYFELRSFLSSSAGLFKMSNESGRERNSGVLCTFVDCFGHVDEHFKRTDNGA